ncbi:hypothetical protein M407DRAFT_21765 [Tulasnella calospora MUT 4182]|uniref:Uncharacterized protein n=1 Tax=Tulasnella calospora MUT 4182 TaxID=1051891 RepID=A0A0C3L5T0_9AGAM|nr:hypothetical protein M407DRAFT_21765 [Tulasnella calospora MUT 4182]
MAKDFIMLSSSEMYPIFVQKTKAALLAARVWKHANTKVAAPTQPSPQTDISQREARIYEENEEQALGIILERLDAANARLVDGKGAHDAWELLETTHVTKTANWPYQLYQELAPDVAAHTKETGLTTRLGQSSRRGPKAGSPTCAHCQKAHKSDDCYTKHPNKMPQWMKDRNEEQHKRQAQQQQPRGASASRATTAEPVSENKSETTSMASSTSSPSPTSSADLEWITDSGATSSMTPHCHWI